MSVPFTGLSAFPLTPADAAGAVDTDMVGRLVDRIASAGVQSIGVLGSTGTYAYLERAERKRALAAALEAAAGRAPVIAGIGALRTDWAQDLAGHAEQAGAAGLLLAPMSYTPLTHGEVFDHFRAVAGASGLPLAIYNNPGTTGFRFSVDLIGRLGEIPQVRAVKMPPAAEGEISGEIAALRAAVPEGFAISYSGDWKAAEALLAGASAWYSVVAGLLPAPALKLAQAALAGRAEETARIESAFAPLWSLFRTHTSLRTMYVIADCLGLPVGNPPLPLQRPAAHLRAEVEVALERLSTL